MLYTAEATVDLLIGAFAVLASSDGTLRIAGDTW